MSEFSMADSFGKEKKEQKILGAAWAYVAPLHNTQVKFVKMMAGLERNLQQPLYRVVIRQRLDLARKAAGQNLPLNTLRWKKKTWSVLCPLAPWGEKGRFLETLCYEKGNNNG
ncbi:hypothetical protein AGMMS49949_02160 [Alphaproteobacteria bacterium]|nr:hypothetical protein AGMMS49949_02160 [Alphaproteobacteria bacterium]GHS96118.1 hypothetical protein AGMMS50296_1940 [Alphaproteobacteria bacterium]